MGYLVIGFILGVAVSWFWQNQYSGKPAFQQLLKKELVVNGQQGTILTLKKRLEMMEKKLVEIENSAAEKETEPQEKPEPIYKEKSANPALTLINKEYKNARGSNKTERNQHREKVLTLWKEGNSVTDIASNTGLGKGEIELIISIKSSNRDTGTGSGKP